MRDLRKVVVVGLVRTPFGRFGGALAGLSGPQLGAIVIDALLARSGVGKEAIDAVYLGVGMIGGSALTTVRQAVLGSTLAPTTPSMGVDRACCSGMTAIGLAYKEIAAGFSDTVICGGFESLSRTPLLMPRRRERAIGQTILDEPLLMRGDAVPGTIAAYTSQEALRLGVTREAQDAWALESHQRYFAAEARNAFAFERMPLVRDNAVLLAADESPRPNTSLAACCAALPTVNGSETITAGNAPGLSDGAAAMMLMSEAKAAELGLASLATILGYTQISGEATSGTSTPAVAIEALMAARQMNATGARRHGDQRGIRRDAAGQHAEARP